MPLRTKVRASNSQRTASLRGKTKLRRPPARPGHGKSTTKSARLRSKGSSNGKENGRNGRGSRNGKHHGNGKSHSNGAGAYAKATRYLSTLTDHERLRIVRYN